MAASDTTRILGIDPGLDITGYGVMDIKSGLPVLVEAGVIRTSHKDRLEKRLKIIYSQLAQLIKDTRPNIGVVEQLYSHYKHPMTAILMAHARGMVLFCLSQHNLEIIGYPAKTAKIAITGSGNASKAQVQRVINRMLNLKDTERPVDVTDALALCLTHIYHMKKNARLFRR
jgi:crossover junction endodeoxyribonuclease RuvC